MIINLPLNFDLSIQHEAEFLDWYDNNSDKIKSTLLCGYFMVKHGLDVYNQNTLESSWIDKYSILKKEKNDSELKYKESVQFLKEQYDHIQKSNPLNQDIIYWRDKHDQLNKEYKDFIKNNTIDKLKSEFDRRESELLTELNIFKNTNQYKGAIGEKTIQDILKKEFTNYEIKDTSGSTSMSDIHLINKDGNIIAIECKNKSTITLQDVEKSMIDIKTLKDKFQDKFLGYLFISIRSKCIPKKGDLYYEIIDSKPVIWYGVDEINDTELIHLIKIINAHKQGPKDTSSDLDNIQIKLKSYMKKLSDNKKSVLLINNNIESLKSNVIIMQNNIDWIYQDIFNYVGEELILDNAPQTSHKCSLCNITFNRKNELTRHNNKIHKD